MSAPLHNITVIELGTMIAVPAASQLLASYGADVIKVEPVSAGDALAFFGSRKNGLSGWYLNANAGKKSIAVDLKTSAGQTILKQLAADADVLIEGFRSGVMDRLGLGYDDLQALNPRLIYCSSTGFGNNGPYADRPAYDPLIQALSGWAGIQEVDGEPTLVRAMTADKVGAANNAQAILAALVQRAGSGRGCHIQTNMLDANISFVWPDVMMDCTLMDPDDVEHLPNLLRAYRLYRATDGWVSIAAGTDKQWQNTCKALDREDLLADETLATSAGRAAKINEWYDIIDSMTAQFPVAEVVRRLVAADVPAAPVLAPDEVYDDPQVRAAGYVQEAEHPVAGRYRQPRRRAAQFDPAAPPLQPAPQWGEHTRQILLKLGYDNARIDKLAADQAVFSPI